MLQSFLDAKPLYYDEIDYTRMPRTYARIQNQIKLPKIIHLIGTNGKGTTGRFLASALFSLGFRVGHYSSPHILKFNERIWYNGRDISDAALQSAHQRLQQLLTPQESDALSYFEYTTLLAIILYEDCDYVVLEAGLGGEHDATAVFENLLTLITPIGMDHEAFLGDTLEKIAATKLRGVQKCALLAKQNSQSVYEVAAEICGQKQAALYRVDEFIEDEDLSRIATISERLGLESYLVENLKLAIAALNYLNIAYSVESFQSSRLFGRLTKIAENILLDVGHNVLAATAIAKSLAGKKYILIYNSYRDKNYTEILSILKPIIKHVQIIRVDEQRIETRASLEEVLNDLKIEHRDFEAIDPAEHYLVFGSFSVAENFLKVYHG